MSQITYGLSGGLMESQISQMHEAMLGIIERVGFQYPHQGILKRLAEFDGVRIDGDVVKFRRDLVEKAISGMTYPEEVKRGDWIINAGAYELNVLDLDTGAIRPSMTKDLIELTKLCSSYNMTGSAPVRPQDIPSTEMQEIAMYKYTWENSPVRCANIFDANQKFTVRAAEYVYEMAQAAKKYYSLGYWTVSPFRATHEELEILCRFFDRGIPMFAATMPIAGATAPIFWPGAFVQSMAEVFAGVTMLSLLNSGPYSALIIDTVQAYPFDMKYQAFVYGAPENIWATMLQVQLNKRYGIPVVAKSLLTAAKEPDAQGAAERAMHTLMAALAGARIFTGCGFISVDEVFSAEQVVIDNEIVQYVQRVLEGFPFSEEALAMQAIEEVGVGGQFLSHDTTLDNWKGAVWEPELFDHPMLQQWEQMGSPTLRDRARKIARKRIAEYEYALPADTQREIDRIYARAQKEILG